MYYKNDSSVVWEIESFQPVFKKDLTVATIMYMYHQSIDGSLYCMITDNKLIGYVEFSESDIDYIIKLFSVKELLSMTRSSDKSAELCKMWDYRHLGYFYQSCADAYRKAILVKRNIVPIKRKHGEPLPSISAEDIKQRVDIVDYIEQFTHLTKSGKNFRGLCPFHSEKSGSFFVYPDKQNWHCFGACNTGGDVIGFVMKYDNVDFKTALYKLSR